MQKRAIVLSTRLTATTPETNRTYIWNASRRIGIVVNDWNSLLVERREIEQFASMKIEPNRNI
jgi:hypothetical protein